ncbi:MAG TPA: hypothetical protein VN581_08600 [Patescibacteria group bacterium]|nr:hypothetical protein [Patescibacteria group bacterium]
MPDDRFQPHPDQDDAALAMALAALPLQTPRADGFAAIAHELALATPRPDHGDRGRRSTTAWLALAATLFAAIIGVRLLHPRTAFESDAASSDADTTRRLIEQSQQLDAVLATIDARSVPIDAASAMASVELENLIGLTDLQLNAATRDDEAEALWSRRVELMTRLAATRSSARFDALSDNDAAFLQDASYRID